MGKLRLISAWWRSFYCQDFYKEVASSWRFGVIGTWFLLCVLSVLVLFAHADRGLNHFFNITLYDVAKQIPDGQIAHGKMSIKAPSPYTVYSPLCCEQAKQPVMVFDMTNHLKPNDTPAAMILYSIGYFYKSDLQKNLSLDAQNISYSFQSYPEKMNFQFSATTAQQLIKEFSFVYPAGFFAVIVLAHFLFKLLQAIFYAFLVMLLGAFWKRRFTYGEAYRLALIALLPSFILIAFPRIFINIEHAWSLAFFIQLAYVFFATYANRANTKIT